MANRKAKRKNAKRDFKTETKTTLIMYIAKFIDFFFNCKERKVSWLRKGIKSVGNLCPLHTFTSENETKKKTLINY